MSGRKGLPLTLVGIYERRKGYRCYIHEWKKVVTFKDVIINEERNPTHPANVGGHEDVPNENEVRIKGYFPPSNCNINCQEE